MKRFLISSAVIVLSATSVFATEQILHRQVFERASGYVFSLPTVQEVLDQFDYSLAEIELGRHLYFETRASLDGDISCASCHMLDMGGVDGLPTSIGHQGQIGGRNAPTVLNAVLNIEQFWDGRAPDLAAQAKGPVENPIEMANTRENLIATLEKIPGYVALFQDAYPDETKPITFDNFAQSIAAFEATLLTPSRFDRFLNGDEAALTLGEKVGLDIFVDIGCVECHNGYNIGGSNYQRFGAVREPSEKYRPSDDVGLAAVTGNKSDEFVFRVPTLRNIALTGPYFHNGSAETLQEAIQVMAEVQLGAELRPADLEMLVLFLNALTGEIPDVAIPDPMPEPIAAPLVPSDPELSLMMLSLLGHPAR